MHVYKSAYCVGVLPVYTDKDTTRCVEQQKEQQYADLRHALQVMSKIATPRKLDQVLTLVTL